MYWLAEVRANLAAVGTTLELDVMRAPASGLPDRMLEQHVRRRPGALWLLYLSTGAVQRWFRDRDVPCVVAGSCAPGIRLTSVDIDHRATSRNATGRMFARGCRRPALLRPEGDHPGEHESEAGFREAWERSRSAAGDPLVLRHDGSVASVCARLDAAIRSKSGADGFLVSRSRHALTALTHLARRGVRVPQDMPLVSRDDDAYLDFVVPRVARYSADPAEFARRLSRAVRARLLSEGDGSRGVRLLPRFIPGETL
jgi:LacI family transcriptional regulator